MSNEKKLTRAREGRKIAGVCQGLALYFGIDPTVIRLLWALAVVLCGCGLIAYIIAWIVIPEEQKLLP